MPKRSFEPEDLEHASRQTDAFVMRRRCPAASSEFHRVDEHVDARRVDEGQVGTVDDDVDAVSEELPEQAGCDGRLGHQIELTGQREADFPSHDGGLRTTRRWDRVSLWLLMAGRRHPQG